MRFSTHLLTGVLLMASVATAHAVPVYSFTKTNPSGSDAGGDIKSVRSVYNPNDMTFQWEYTIENKNDGFWLVTSNGPNPKSHVNELAILYGDLKTNRILAYEYDGKNNADSFKSPGTLLGAWNDALRIERNGDGTKNVSFKIDVAGVNAAALGPTWQGIGFEKSLGIWFHPSTKSRFKYKRDGSLKSFSAKAAGWYDTNHRTTAVPEPSALYLLAAGLLGLGFARRKWLHKAV